MVEHLNGDEGQEQRPADGGTPNPSNNTGIVYILSNQAMPEYLKIGMTGGDSPRDVLRRMKELDNTNLPISFDCEYAAVVNNYKQVEQALHTAFGGFRTNPKREFFQGIEVLRVQAVLDLIKIKDVTLGVTDEADGETSTIAPKGRSLLFTFKMIGIPIGARLKFLGNPEIECEVVDDKSQVEYEDNRYSLSGLATSLKNSRFGLRGSNYWVYEGETLQARRERLEENHSSGDE